MKKEISCKKCDTVIANDNGECIIPIKTRMRFNYKEMLSTILCQSCNFLNYFRENEILEDSEKRNAQYILENSTRSKYPKMNEYFDRIKEIVHKPNPPKLPGTRYKVGTKDEYTIYNGDEIKYYKNR